MRLTKLDETNRVAFEKLLREPWGQDSWCKSLAQKVVQWRYFDRNDESAATWLVMDDDRCVAMLDSMARPFLLNGERILVRETADWFALPQARSSASGLLLMFELMKYPEPTFVLGGSPANVQLLTTMQRRGWTLLSQATNYVLPVKVHGLAANLIRRQWYTKERLANAIPKALPLRTPRRIRPPEHRVPSIKLLDHNDTVSLPSPPTSSGLVQLFDQQHWQWLVRMPRDLAEVIGVQFFLDDVYVAFACLQVEPTITGYDGKIIYLQAADDLLSWVISESSRLLVDRGVEYIRICTSTASKDRALREVGYMRVRDCTSHWRGRGFPKPDSIDVSFLRIDDSVPFHAAKGRCSGDCKTKIATCGVK